MFLFYSVLLDNWISLLLTNDWLVGFSRENRLELDLIVYLFLRLRDFVP